MNLAVEVGAPIPPEELLQLYLSVGWSKHAELEKVKIVLAQSDITVSARVGATLAGFGRALTDRILYATIHDLIVHPQYQRKGIGSAILEQLLQELRGVRKVSLSATAGAQEFYQKYGFQPAHNSYHLYQW